jgi:hypothetical protein
MIMPRRTGAEKFKISEMSFSESLRNQYEHPNQVSLCIGPMSARSDYCKSTSTHSRKSLPVQTTIDGHNKGRLISSTLKGAWQFVITFATALLLFGWCRRSELVVNSDHGAQYNPQAIREVERILRLNLAVSR